MITECLKGDQTDKLENVSKYESVLWSYMLSACDDTKLTARPVDTYKVVEAHDTLS